MASKNIELRVGILIILAIAIFVGTIIWIQGWQFGQDNYTIEVFFNDVGALAKGDPVMVAGIKMGKVTSLKLVEGGVNVTIMVEDDVKLGEDATITIRNRGLMGERYVAINPGSSEERLDITLTVQGDYEAGIPEAMGLIGDMVSELRDMVHVLRHSVASDENLENLTKTVANLNELTNSLSVYFEENRVKFETTANNFMATSAELKEVVSNNSGRIDSVMVRADTLTERLSKVVSDLEKVSASAREFAERLNYGDGTLQMMVDDRRLYDDLRAAADNLDDLIQDIRENPRKYIQLKVELF